MRYTRGTHPNSIKNLQWNNHRKTPPEERRYIAKSINISEKAMEQLNALMEQNRFRSMSHAVDSSLRIVGVLAQKHPDLFESLS